MRTCTHRNLDDVRHTSSVRVALPRNACGHARRFGLAGVLVGMALSPVSAAEWRGAPARQTLHVAYWNTASGLPQGSINELLQTSDGVLWIATFGGLLRFDGVSFRLFDLDTLPGLPSNRLTSLTSDGADGMWIATQAGDLVHLRDHSIVESRPPREGTRAVVSLVRDRSQALWVGTDAGPVLRLAGREWTEVLGKGPTGEYESIGLDSAGDMRVAHGRELHTFDAHGARVSTAVAPARIAAITAALDGGVWVGLADGLALERGGTIERIEFQPPFRGPVHALLTDPQGGVWLGTDDGPRLALRESASEAWTLAAPLAGVPDHFRVRSFLRDREGNVWVGSDIDGLLRLTSSSFERFTFERSAGGIALAEDRDGNVWVSGALNSLGRVSAGADESLPARMQCFEMPERPLFGLARDAGGRMWLGLADRLVRTDALDGAGAVVRADVSVADFTSDVTSIAPLADGSVWAASRSGRLVHVDESGAVLETSELGEDALCLEPGLDGDLWIGGRGSILHYVRGETTRTSCDVVGQRVDVRDLLVDRDGSVWAATYGAGLLRLVDGRVQRLSCGQGLPDNALSALLEDDEPRLWILTNLGLVVAPKAELVAVLEGRSTRVDPIVIGPETGMPEGNYGSPAGLRDSAGRFWFTTVGGAACVDSSAFPFNRTPPAQRVDRIEADGRSFAAAADLALPAGTRRFTIEYTAFALRAPERVKFRYRLEGFDDHWIDAGEQRQASYTAVSPGQYRFTVMARNEDGVWNRAPATLAFEVLPTWWQTRAFYAAATVAALGALYAADVVRTGMVRRRERERQRIIQAQADAEEHASRLRLQLAHASRVATAGELATSLAHEVNQPLAAIVANAQAGRKLLASAPIDQREMESILRDIAQEGQRASEVIRRLREYLRKHAVERKRLDVNDIVRDTLPLVRREMADHGVALHLDLHPSPPPIAADFIQVQQVLVNLIKNACEALEGAAGERRIDLRTSVQSAQVELEVRDNGPGIPPDIAARLFEPYTSSKVDGMGLGLTICRTIVESHGGHIRVASELARGAAFRLSLPALEPRGGSS